MPNLLRCRRVLNSSWRGLGYRQVTSRFLDYFRERQHVVVPSSSLLAPPETGVLFTNAGMNQFVNILSGSERPWCGRAVSLQDCVRVGGKHNDLDEVGHDGHHHTFFQMLGNWSFGDYFKHEACSFALELLTLGYGLNKDQLVVTYFGGDRELSEDVETKNIWLSLGIRRDNIVRRDSKDNFWEMGQTGPCGPCTEIHIVSEGDLRELWNLVFIQYNRLSDGSLRALPTPFVDTGMGLERLCAILQGKASNYDTDLFAPIIQELERASGLLYTGRFDNNQDDSFRLVADHCRMVTKALAGGILPDHRNAGNKLRRVLRRAVHVSQSRLRLKPGQFAELSKIAADILDVTGVSEIRAIINDEEERYLAMLRKADRVFSDEQPERAALNQDALAEDSTLTGDTAWNLYLKCGLTRENIEDFCSQKSIKKIDWDGFEKKLEDFKQKSQSKSSKSFKEQINLETHVNALKAASIQRTEQSKIYQNVYEISSVILYCAEAGDNCWVLVVGETCFYPEGGGQAADIGTISIKAKQVMYQVRHVAKVGDHILHVIEGLQPGPTCGDEVYLSVDRPHRDQCTWHHTACHLLNAAIKDQLGLKAQQHSSAVYDRYFRLDIVSRSSVDVGHVEEFINSAISANILVETIEVDRTEAMSDPRVIWVPGEIYPSRVRLVRCGDVSVEPCCGTHVARTGEIPQVVVLSSRSLGVNLKSITATAAHGAEAIQNAEVILAKVKALQNAIKHLTPEILPELVKNREQLRSLRRELAGQFMIPHSAVADAENKLLNVDRNIEQLIRKNNKLSEEKVATLLADFPQENPFIRCFLLDCDFDFFMKLFRQRRQSLDRSQPYFVALQSCGKVYVEMFVSPTVAQSVHGWKKSFIDGLGGDGVLCAEVRRSNYKGPAKDRIQLRLDALIGKEKIEASARRFRWGNATEQSLSEQSSV